MQACPVCEAIDLVTLLTIDQVPIACNVLMPSRAEALNAPRGKITLCFCGSCGHICNADFDPYTLAYTPAYENSLHFSPHFQRYAEALAADLIERYELYGKTVVDIGCGRGDFLKLICTLGQSRGIGFDRSYRLDDTPTAEGISFIPDFYAQKYAEYGGDLFICRHVLEHVASPRAFLAMIRAAIADRQGVTVVFEVPNVLYTLRDGGIWDLIYEHVSYFSAPSLQRVFAQSGFDVLRVAETYHGQFLCIEARPSRDPKGEAGGQAEVATIAAYAVAFGSLYQETVTAWSRKLRELQHAGRQAAIWGSGSKGVTFLNVMGLERTIEYAVDINPRKHGKFIPGTGQQVIAPALLALHRPDTVVVMNPVYLDEIGTILAALGVSVELIDPRSVARPAHDLAVAVVAPSLT